MHSGRFPPFLSEIEASMPVALTVRTGLPPPLLVWLKTSQFEVDFPKEKEPGLYGPFAWFQ